MTDDALGATPRYLYVAPDSCLGEVNRLTWLSTTVVRVGEYHVGVRANNLAVQHAIEMALCEHLVDDSAAPASFAIYEPEAKLTNARPLYRVYRDCHHIFTTPSLDRAIAFVATQLEHLLPGRRPPTGSLELGAAALVGPRSAVLMPWFLPYMEPHAELLARRQGARLLEGFSVVVEPASAELVVLPSPLLSSTPLNDTGSSPARVPPGRWPITNWTFFGNSRLGSGRAHAVARAMHIVYWHLSPAENLLMLADLVRQLEISVVDNLSGLLPTGLKNLNGRPRSGGDDR